MSLLNSKVTFNMAQSWDAAFPTVSSSNFCHAKAAPVNCKCCYGEVEMLHKLTEWDHCVLRRIKIVCPPFQHSLLSSKLPLEATSAQ
jgi:hypothetical protein